jgi:hypothetical protein
MPPNEIDTLNIIMDAPKVRDHNFLKIPVAMTISSVNRMRYNSYNRVDNIHRFNSLQEGEKVPPIESCATGDTVVVAIQELIDRQYPVFG